MVGGGGERMTGQLYYSSVPTTEWTVSYYPNQIIKTEEVKPTLKMEVEKCLCTKNLWN